MFSTIWNSCKRVGHSVLNAIKKWTKPVSGSLAVSATSDCLRSRHDLIIENAILRQQLIVLNRSVKRPQFTSTDRLQLVLLARLTRFWQSAIYIIQPDTVLRWHRDLFRRYWRWKSRSKQQRKPRISAETIALIQQMARDNRLWGAERIRGELLKLGIKVGKPTVQKYMRIARQHSGGQNWSTFLRNHAHEIWACDFVVVHDLLFRPIYIFVIMAHHTREIIHTAITRHPTDCWIARQLKAATPWGSKPRFLIRDNDKKFGTYFSEVARSSSIKEIKTPLAAPRANAICERFMGSLRRECLDCVIALSPQQLRRIVNEYVAYYNGHRPHQGIQQSCPSLLLSSQTDAPKSKEDKVVATSFLFGLHHSYSYATNSC